MIEQLHRPATVRAALALQRRLRGKAPYLAGGTWLNSLDSGLHPGEVVSLDQLGLDTLTVKAGALAIGACVTLQRLLDEARVPAPLQAAVAQVLSRNIRNAGTLGGHVAAHLPQSDVTPMLVALGAGVVLAGVAKPLPLETYAAKRPAGLVTAIVLPKAPKGRQAACRNLRESAAARSLVSVAASLTLAKGVVTAPVVALTGASDRVVRLSALERALAGRPLPAPDALQALAGEGLRVSAAAGASAAYRRYEATALVALVLHDAATGGAR